MKISPTELLEIQKYIEENIKVDEKIYDYTSGILEATRMQEWKEQVWWIKDARKPSETSTQYIEYWASTRAGLALIRCARVWALLEGRDFVMPEDIKSLAHEILRHRIGLSYEAVSEGITTDMIIKNILDNVRIP